jgi:hypothetical protein
VQTGDQCSVFAGESPDGAAELNGGPDVSSGITSTGLVVFRHGRRCGKSWVQLWNVVYNIPQAASRVLLVIFGQKTEIEGNNDKNRWPRDETRMLPEERSIEKSDGSGSYLALLLVSKKVRV